MIKYLIYVMLIFNLVGCSNTKFQCPNSSAGVKCMGLTDVSDKIKQGDYDKYGVIDEKKKRKSQNGKTPGLEVVVAEGYKQPPAVNARHLRAPYRIPEKTLDIYLTPYVSEDGTYHQANHLYAVVIPAHWEGEVAK